MMPVVLFGVCVDGGTDEERFFAQGFVGRTGVLELGSVGGCPSHNALLAFAYATSRVREYTPDAVRRVLGTLRLDAKDSTVAYPLDFSSSYAAGGQVGFYTPRLKLR